MMNFGVTSTEVQKRLRAFDEIVARLEKKGIELKEISRGGNPVLEKKGYTIEQNIATWQCVVDDTRPDITIEFVVESIVRGFEDAGIF